MVNGMDGQVASKDLAEVSDRLALALRGDDNDIAVAPISAGMRARAVADACDALNLPAMLMGHDGRVLHVCREAHGFFGPELRLESDHMVSPSVEGNRAIAHALNALLADGFDDTAQQCQRWAHAVITVVHYADRTPFQLLRGLLIFSPRDDRIAAIESMLMGGWPSPWSPLGGEERSTREIA